MSLWPHQIEAIRLARQQYREGSRSILIVLPTGGGKTRVAVTMAASGHSKGNRVLWIVHRAELVQQAADELRAQGVACGIIAPWAGRIHEPVQVASIQTLVARDMRPDADILVADEAHHLVAPTFLEVRKSYENALVIGLTATPCRADNKGLGHAFASMVATVQPRELIASGHLVPAIVIGPTKARDNLAADPIDAYRQHADGRQSIVFCASVRAAVECAQAFSRAGISARCVDGTMSADSRADAIAKFRAGEVRVLTNMHVLTEGFDVRETSCIILARKMGSEPSYIQAVGRGMRCAPDKTDCIVLDLCGSSHEIGLLPDSDRIYSLDGKGVSTTSNQLQLITQCQQCGAVFRAEVFRNSTCPRCGYVRPGKKDPRVAHAEMVQLQSAKLQNEFGTKRTDVLRTLLQKCAAKGHKPGVALMQFKSTFHHWPNEAMKNAAGWPTGFAKGAR